MLCWRAGGGMPRYRIDRQGRWGIGSIRSEPTNDRCLSHWEVREIASMKWQMARRLAYAGILVSSFSVSLNTRAETFDGPCAQSGAVSADQQIEDCTVIIQSGPEPAKLARALNGRAEG